MAMSPLLLGLLEDIARDPIYDQDFGIGMFNDELVLPRRLNRYSPRIAYLRPWSRQNSGMSTVASDKNEFKVSLDVKQFKPEEISVKVLNNCVVIEGKHEERQDEHGFISREFKRRYHLPNDVDPGQVSSALSSDGVLCVSAPKVKPAIGEERSIPIVQTNAPAVKHGEPKNGKNEEMEQ